MVYEQSESLKPAADRFKLEVKTARDVKRAPEPGATGPLANARFLEALFATDTIRNKRNTDAIETASNQLVSGRVVEYAPARTLPLMEVKDKVRQQVAARQAAALASKEGEARLAQLKREPQAAMPGNPVVVSRAQPKDLPRPVVDALLRADAGTLPAVVGVELGDSGYAVARVTKVLGRDPVGADTARAQNQYAQTWGEAEAHAYYASLKRRLKVNVHDKAIATDDVASAPAR
jgi:peptidyl-prolyl cis-trans isomerase D